MADVVIGAGGLPTTGGTLTGDLNFSSGTDINFVSGTSDVADLSSPIGNLYATNATFTTISGTPTVQFLSPVIDASGNSFSPVSIFSETINVTTSGATLRNVTLSKNALSFLSCFVHYTFSGDAISINPHLVSSDPTGVVYILDANSIINVYDSNTRSLILVGGGGSNSSDNIFATGANIGSVAGITIDENRNIYFTDNANRVRKINSSGIITTIANTGSTSGFFGDGGLATEAQLANPVGIAFSSGNLFIGDVNNSRVRKIDPSGIITTFAGGGDTPWDGTTQPATGVSIINPCAIAVDPSGNVYIGEFNGSPNRMPRIDSTGIMYHFAGNGVDADFTGDGIPATGSGFGLCNSMKFINNNLYFYQPNMQRVRYIDSTGIIHTLAGTGVQGFSGDGGPATGAMISLQSSFQQHGIGIGMNNSIVFNDVGNARIRTVNSTGTISTLIGNGLQSNIYGEFILNSKYAPPSYSELAKRQNVFSSSDIVISHSGNILSLDLRGPVVSNIVPSGFDKVSTTYLTNE